MIDQFRDIARAFAGFSLTALRKELVEARHELILELLLVHRWRRCLSPGAGGPQLASGFIFGHRLPRLIAFLEGVVLMVRPKASLPLQVQPGMILSRYTNAVASSE